MSARLNNSDANSTAVRKRIERHTFENEEGEEYGASAFGGFPEYFRRKKIKLQNLDAELRASSEGCPPIFRGVVAQVNGYTQPSLNDLHNMIVSHGGGFQQYLDGKTTVTHIIAASLTPKKRVEFRRYRIVKPAWVVDSIKAGKLLPWDVYRVIDDGPGQRVIGLDGGKVTSQTSNLRRGYREQTDNSWYTTQVKGVVNDINDGFDEATDFPSSQREAKARQTELESVSAQAIAAAVDAPLNLEMVRGDMLKQKEDVLKALADAEVDPDLALDVSFSVDNDSLPRSQAPPRGSPLDVQEESTGQDDSHAITDSVHDRCEDIDEVDKPATERSRSVSLKRTISLDASPPAKRPKLTAEEHNIALLSDPRMRKSSTVNPDFLKQYYSESRLHHLSNWKANLKAQIQQLTAEKSSSQRSRERRPPGSRRYILHVDFDSFFAAVSLKRRPELKDQPVVVAHGSGNGSEIASCNYVARDFGVKNGMWMKRAMELCPDLHVLPYDFKAYEEASRHFYEAILALEGIVQSVSIDEALIDVSSLCVSIGATDGKGISEGSIWREQAKADEIAQGLRDRVHLATKCHVSVGIGGNILLAKVALRRAKPAGQYHLKPDEVLDFIGELTVQDLPGVAHSIGGKLEEISVIFVKDVRGLSKERLVSTLGPKTGERIWDYSRGIDRTEVGEQVIRKSVSAEVNWGVRFETQAQAEEFICSLCDELHRRLIEQRVKGRQITMKIMRRAADAPMDPPKNLGHGKCDVFNKSVVLGVATNAAEVLQRETLSVLRGYGFSPGELRGLGVQMTKLEPIKSVGDSGVTASSQKRLQFQTAKPPRKPIIDDEPADPIIDGPITPPKATKLKHGRLVTPTTSEAQASLKPLNTSGTQFVLPSQIDPKVLAELPEEIRSKLMPSKASASTIMAPHSISPFKTEPRAVSPNPPRRSAAPTAAAPTQSQLDPEALAALPEDVRAEILAFYNTNDTPSPRTTPRKSHAQAQQSLLPQSPRKIRPNISSRKPITPTKRRTATVPTKHSLNTTLTTQSNLLPLPPHQPSNPTETPTLDPFNEPDPEFLAALPASIRAEVLAEHRRARLSRSSLSLAHPHPRTRPRPAPNTPHHPQLKRVLRLPPRPNRPTFTAQKLHTLPELRALVSKWVTEFEDEDGGPYAEDVDDLAGFLERVCHAGDMSLAVDVVKWLIWSVDEIDTGRIGKLDWERATHKVKDRVQQAFKARGLGPAEL